MQSTHTRENSSSLSDPIVVCSGAFCKPHQLVECCVQSPLRSATREPSHLLRVLFFCVCVLDDDPFISENHCCCYVATSSTSRDGQSCCWCSRRWRQQHCCWEIGWRIESAVGVPRHCRTLLYRDRTVVDLNCCWQQQKDRKISASSQSLLE